MLEMSSSSRVARVLHLVQELQQEVAALVEENEELREKLARYEDALPPSLESSASKKLLDASPDGSGTPEGNLVRCVSFKRTVFLPIVVFS